MEAGGGGSPEVVAADGKSTAERRTRRLTQEEIDYAMAVERTPFRPPGLDLFARLPQGKAVLESLARAAKHVDKLDDDKMKYKERVLREYAEKGYVDLTD